MKLFFLIFLGVFLGLAVSSSDSFLLRTAALPSAAAVTVTKTITKTLYSKTVTATQVSVLTVTKTATPPITKVTSKTTIVETKVTITPSPIVKTSKVYVQVINTLSST